MGMAVLWAGEMSKSLGSEDVAGTTDPVFFWGPGISGQWLVTVSKWVKKSMF